MSAVVSATEADCRRRYKGREGVGSVKLRIMQHHLVEFGRCVIDVNALLSWRELIVTTKLEQTYAGNLSCICAYYPRGYVVSAKDKLWLLRWDVSQLIRPISASQHYYFKGFFSGVSLNAYDLQR